MPRVSHEPVDDQDVDREHKERPDRESRNVVQLPDRVDARDEDPEPTRHLAAPEEAERSDKLKDAQEQNDPAPGIEVAEHERLVRGVDPRVRDREDAFEHIERPDQPEHDRREGDPAAAGDIVLLRVDTSDVIATSGHASPFVRNRR